MSQELPLLSRIKPLVINNHYEKGAVATLFHGDRLTLLDQIKRTGEKAELIVTSPPYNIGKEYETVIPLEQYIDDQKKTIKACVEILSDTGSICWQVGHYIDGSGKSKEAFPLDLVLYPIFKEFDLVLKNRIIWHFGHGLHETFRFSGRHETILWFTKRNDDYTFNLDPIRVPQKYPGKRSYRGDNKGQLSGNPKGKNPSDVWNIPNVKSNHVEKTDHPCQFPIGLINRLILSMTNENDLVVDPYIGVGTVSATAIMNKRRAAGADTDEVYLAIAKQRTINAFTGELKYRPMNKPVYKPQNNSKIAVVPDEWKSTE